MPLNTVRFTGTIQAVTPIFITRPEQGENPLLMTVIRQGAATRVHAIPGETIKGLLRAKAFEVCVDAASAKGAIQTTLDAFYLQTAGGLSFTKDSPELGAAEALRPKQPLLSLFGAASPKLTGRISVDPAIAQPITGGADTITMSMPPGTRRDQLTASAGLAQIIQPHEQQKWARQATIISGASHARATLESAERALRRAEARNRDKQDTIDLASLKANVEAAKGALTAFEADEDFEHAIQRPLPPRQAAPAGLIYDHCIRVNDATDAEVGLLLATFQKWALDARIGGGRTAGYGRVSVRYTIEVLGSSALPRQQHFAPVGAITIGQEGDTAASAAVSPVDRWLSAWGAVEETIEQTGIFQ